MERIIQFNVIPSHKFSWHFYMEWLMTFTRKLHVFQNQNSFFSIHSIRLSTVSDHEQLPCDSVADFEGFQWFRLKTSLYLCPVIESKIYHSSRSQYRSGEALGLQWNLIPRWNTKRFTMAHLNTIFDRKQLDRYLFLFEDHLERAWFSGRELDVAHKIFVCTSHALT